MLCLPTCEMSGSTCSAARAAPSWRCPMIDFFIAAAATFFGLFVLGPMVSAFCRACGFYTVVQERQCRVYMLFGKVALVLDEPGLHLLWLKLGWKAPLVTWLGRCLVLDMRLDQEYLRSQPVNSEE